MHHDLAHYVLYHGTALLPRIVGGHNIEGHIFVCTLKPDFPPKWFEAHLCFFLIHVFVMNQIS